MSAAAAGAGAGEGARERRALAGRAGIVGAGTLASRVLGLARDQTLAALFSRGETDAFWVAFTLPNALRQLLGEGAASSAVVPVLAEVRASAGDDDARRFFARIRGLSLVTLAIVTVAGVAFAPALVELFAAGMRARPGAFEETVELSRWLFPYIFFMGTAALGAAALNTYGRFAAAAFAPALLNVAFIACAFVLRRPLAARGISPVLALAAGALIGGALQVIAQWPSLAKIGMLGAPSWSPRDALVRRALVRMAPMTVGIGIYYVDLVLSRRFLSELPEGAQSYFSWAMRLCDFPQGIFVMALSAATLPSLSSLVARGHLDEVGKTYAYSMRLALFVAIPATALLTGLARPLVVALFERGAFDAQASTETARALVAPGLGIFAVAAVRQLVAGSRALVAQGLGIFAVAAVRQLVAVYYALGDTRTPVVVSAIDLCAFIVLALTLRAPLGHIGIGIAVTGSSVVQMLLLWARLSRRLPGRLHLGEIGKSAARTLAASGAALVAGRSTAAGLLAIAGGGAAGRAFPGLAGAVVFAAVFLVCARSFRSAELDVVLSGVRRRLERRGGARRARIESVGGGGDR